MPSSPASPRGDLTLCVYNIEKDFFAANGMCTHEARHLEDGIVIGTVIECPLHQARFDIPTGKVLSAPACEDLKSYAAKFEEGVVYVALPQTPATI